MYQCVVAGEDRAEDVPVCCLGRTELKMYQCVVAGEDRAEDVPVCCCWGGQS